VLWDRPQCITSRTQLHARERRGEPDLFQLCFGRLSWQHQPGKWKRYRAQTRLKIETDERLTTESIDNKRMQEVVRPA